MKKFTTAILAATAIVMAVSSCGKKTSPEDEVRDYAKHFIAKADANQLDSLTASYAGIAEADSIVKIETDTIVVVGIENEPNTYAVTFAPGMTMKVNLADDGAISVAESSGLFAFPADRMAIAQNTGMLADNPNDVQLTKRMKDDEFFNMIKKQKQVKSSDLISVGRLKITKDWDGIESHDGKGYYPLTNKTGTDIKGSDYIILLSAENVYMGTKNRFTEKGKDIPAGGTVNYNVSFRPRHDVSVSGVKFNASDEELSAKFAPYTGKEYEEYMASKK